ncbi:unnamed protein product [Hymenolepis diminuta]|uniref:Secreted protein n=1 Tax=Hymenolepis diminuta TaxID=6216 RepID=A0A564YEB6_HYMDI|nr:unnamed protein product [Hymenolepis diminuta]
MFLPLIFTFLLVHPCHNLRLSLWSSRAEAFSSANQQSISLQLSAVCIKDQARGQRLIRGSVHRIKFLLSHRLRINKPSLLDTVLVLTTLGAN